MDDDLNRARVSLSPESEVKFLSSRHPESAVSQERVCNLPAGSARQLSLLRPSTERELL